MKLAGSQLNWARYTETVGGDTDTNKETGKQSPPAKQEEDHERRPGRERVDSQNRKAMTGTGELEMMTCDNPGRRGQQVVWTNSY